MTPTRRTCVLVLLAAVIALPRLGCIVIKGEGGDSSAKFKATRAITAPAGRSIDAQTVNGSVTIRRAERADTAVTAKLALQTQERLDATRVLADLQENGTVLVHVAWPDGKPRNGESCSFEITVPKSTAGGVTVKTSNGAIDLADLAGPAHLQSSNGRIAVATHAGDVYASTSNGASELSNITGSAEAHTSNGAITLCDIAGRATAHTSNGRVSITLAANNANPIDVQTSNGSADVTLPTSYAGRISISTSNGSIDIPKNKPLRILDSDKNHVSFQIGDSSVASTVSTSNGSVNVRMQ